MNKPPSASPSSKATPKKKRSMVERIFVWGGILVLLGIVLIEWTSQRNYATTLDDLEKAIQSKQSVQGERIAGAEIDRHVHGFTFKGEANSGVAKFRTFRWPSLFKFYKVGVALDDQGRATAVETFLAETESSEKPKAPSNPVGITQPLPKQGIPAELTGSVALLTKEISQSIGFSDAGSLSRELIRQSFLMAAREEFGQTTLDASLDEFSLVDNPAEFPFELRTTIVLGPVAPDDLQIEVSIERPMREGKGFRWDSKKIKIQRYDWLGSLAEQAEILSRTEFVTALREAGVQKNESKSSSRAVGSAPDKIPMDLVSQFELLRQLHVQRASDGDSSQRLARLVCAYANLGSLIDYHWSPASKVCAARALLYAQRLVANQGATPFALSHRSYARALVGCHRQALDDVNAAREAKGEPAPEWLDLIEAFCTYNVDVLEEPHGPLGQLAAYLRMRLSDPVNNLQEALKSIEKFSRSNPACFRTTEVLCEAHSLGILRATTEGGFDQVWPDVYDRITKMEGLPKPVLDIAKSESRSEVGPSFVPRSAEYSSRVRLIAELKIASASEKPRTELSWRALGGLLSDATMVQVWRRLDVEANALAIPTDATLERVFPLIQGHRYEKFITSYSSDPTLIKALTDFAGSVDRVRLEPPALPMALWCYQRIGFESYQPLAQAIATHGDPIFDDVKRQINPSANDDMFTGMLYYISPHHPDSIVQTINNEWERSQDKIKDWESRYEESPQVLQALATKFRSELKLDDAERCLNKSIDANPTHKAYRELVEIYKRRGQIDNCKQTLEIAAQLPSFGLEQAAVQMDLSKIMMREGDWKGAAPIAFAAAESYSGWALNNAARCAEGLGDWRSAEAFHRAGSERYENDAAGWYFWCLRTGKGNVRAARAVAKAYWDKLRPPYRGGQWWSVGVGNILADNPNGALLTFQDADGLNPDLYALMMVTILADKLDDVATRSKMLDSLSERPELNLELANLVDLFNRSLKVEGEFRWNKNLFEDLIIEAADQSVTWFYYFAGEFVGKHGLEDLSREYLANAATSFDVDSHACLLAGYALKSRGIQVGEPRAQEMADSLQPFAKLLKDGRFAEMDKKFDVAQDRFEKAVQMRPDSMTALFCRGRFLERRGRYREALADYQAAIRIEPDSDDAHSFLGWLLATCDQDDIRDGKQALEHARKAMDLRTVKSPSVMASYAAAMAETGDFLGAAAMEATSDRIFKGGRELHSRLKLYREQKPYHRPPVADKQTR